MSSYESHPFLKDDFPIIIHRDQVSNAKASFFPHWQENIELLCFVKGSGTVQLDAEQIAVATGDLIVINPNQLHRVWTDQTICEYDCLIISNAFLESQGLPMSKLVFENKLNAEAYVSFFERITMEKGNGEPYYKTICKAAAVQMISELARSHARTEKRRPPEQMERIKDGVNYLKDNFREPVTVEQVCATAGLSKYYFCRLFKEYTGLSVIQYLNRLRCEEAKRLLSGGQYNVSQAAQMSGFNNLSYFSRTYFKQMGCLPSRTTE